MNIEVRNNCSLKEFSYFKIGGTVRNLYFPKNVEELVFLLNALKNPQVFGGFSNVIFSSIGVKEDLICTSKMSDYEINNNYVTADCGVRGAVLSRAVMEKSLTGFEFMSGFPGTVGGNLYMNASAHGQCISDNLLEVEVFDAEKKQKIILSKTELKFNYRKSILQETPFILLRAKFSLNNGNKDEISERIIANKKARKESQPQGIPNAGSIFKNPDGYSAGKLLDECGVKNLKFGGAKVFENHANFIVNISDAKSSDVLELMFMMYNKVKEKFDIKLVPEVKFFGEKNEREKEICTILYQK